MSASAGAALKAQRDGKDLRRRFGGNVRTARDSIGLSQVELGSRCAMHRTEVSLIERGHREPRLEVVIKLAAVLGKSVDELLAGIEWEEPNTLSAPYGEFRVLP